MAEAVGLAGSIAGLVQIAASIARLSYSYVLDVMNAPKTQKLYLQEVSAFVDVLLRTEQALLESETAGLVPSRPATLSEAVIKDCQQQLTALQLELEKRVRRLLWPFQEKELRKHIDNLTRFRRMFADFVSANILTSTVGTYKKLEVMDLKQEKQQLLTLLHNPDEPRRSKPTACDGTCVSFLESEDYKDWRDGGKELLWCYGAPGVGKSLLASIVIDDVREQREKTPSSVAYYFCEFSSRKKQTPLAILQALLRQLVEQGDANVLSQVRDDSSDPSKLRDETDVSRIIARVCSLRKTHLIIDAPDELEKPGDLLCQIQNLVDSGGRVLITSRDVSKVRRHVEKATKVQVRSAGEDMRKYLANRFRESELCDDGDVSPFTGLIDDVISKSGNLFLLSKLMADDLLEEPTIRKMRKALESFPTSLTAAFSFTLERIDAQPKSSRALARRLLSWVTHSMRRLRIEEIVEAFAVDEEEDEVFEDNMIDSGRLLRLCIGMVVIDQEDQTVGLIHTTAYEFFGRISPDADAHRDIAQTCLLYLCLKPFRTESCSNAQSITNHLRKMPFLGYSASYWGKHVFDEKVEEAVQSHILTLLKDKHLRCNAFQTLQFRVGLQEDLAEAFFSSIPTGQEPLHIAAFWNLRRTAAILLQDGPNPSPSDSQNWTPLHWACSNGHVGVTETLLQHSADVNAQDSQGWTPLFWAGFNGHVEIVKLLLTNSANHLLRSTLGWTALHWAISRGQYDVLEAILSHHASCMSSKTGEAPIPLRSLTYREIVLRGSSDSISPIEIATGSGDQKIFDTLVDHLSSTESAYGDEAFNNIWSREKFDEPVANPWRTLMKGEEPAWLQHLTQCPSRDWSSRSQWTKGSSQSSIWKSKLLMSAIRDNKFDSARLLIRSGADVNFSNRASPLHLAAFRRDPRFCHKLLQHGADPGMIDERGYTALHHAILNGYTEVVIALLEGGSNPNTRVSMPEDEELVFRLSCYSRRDRFGKLRWPVSKTPLILASGLVLDEEPNEELASKITKLLLDHGADPTMVDDTGMSPLHYASMHPYLPLMAQLMNAGASTDILNKSKRTPFHDLAEFADIDLGFDKLRLVIKAMIEKLSDGNVERILNQVAPRSKYRYQYVEIKSTISSTKTIANDLSSGTDIEDTAMSETHLTPVTLALENAHWDIFRIFKECGGEIPESFPLDPILEKAIGDLQPSVATTLLSHGARPTDNAFLLLVESLVALTDSKEADEDLFGRFASILSTLQSTQAEIDWCDSKSGVTALLTAVKLIDDDKVIEALVNTGADPHFESERSFDVFITAAIHANRKSLHWLMEHETVDAKPESAHLLYYHRKDEINDYKHISLCLQERGLIRRTKIPGQTVLHLAAIAGNCNLIAALLACGAEVDRQDDNGFTPVHFAAFELNVDAVRLLYPLGNTSTPNQSSAMKLTKEHRLCPEIDLEKLNDHGETMLNIAVRKHHTPLVQHLLGLGADVGYPVRWVWCEMPVLCGAAERGYDNLVISLLDYGADIEAPCSHGWRALHNAAWNGHETTVRILIARGANIFAATIEWNNFFSKPPGLDREVEWTAQPLHLAAMCGYVNIVRLLLEHGADVRASTGTSGHRNQRIPAHGPTALHMALNRTYYISNTFKPLCPEYLEISKMLVEAGADVRGVADQLEFKDVLRFQGFEDLWDRLREGITEDGQNV